MTNVGACQRMAEAFWGLAGASGGASWGSLKLLGGAHWGLCRGSLGPLGPRGSLRVQKTHKVHKNKEISLWQILVFRINEISPLNFDQIKKTK